MVNALKIDFQVERVVIISAPASFPDVIFKFGRILNLSALQHQALRETVQDYFSTDDQVWSRFTAYKSVAAIEQPCLIVHDENDEEVLLVEAECLVEALPNANLLKTQRLGHVKTLRSKAVVQGILQHLA